MWKLLNNSVFAKTVQNKRKQRKREFATKEKTRNKSAYSGNIDGVPCI